MSPNPNPDVLKSVTESLTRPSIRKAFAVDPLRALERAGIDTTQVPAEFVDALADLSPEELDTLVRINDRVNSKLPESLARGHDGAIIF